MKGEMKMENNMKKKTKSNNSSPQDVWRVNFNLPLYLGTPNRSFEIGDKVRTPMAGHIEGEVIEKHPEHPLYRVKVKFKHKKEEIIEQIVVFAWYELSCEVTRQNTQFRKERNFFTSGTTRTLDGLILDAFSFGFDGDLPYQRGYVWMRDDEEALIDSIFRNINIGSFAINRREFKEDQKGYDVIDGKQRLHTLCSYVRGDFSYQGVFFHDLSNADRTYFNQTVVTIIEARELTLKQQMEWFIELNTRGKDVEQEHIREVEKLLIGLGIEK